MNSESITPVSPVPGASPISAMNTRAVTQNQPDAEGDTDRTQLTRLGELLSKLQQLASSDPARATQVLTSIASALTARANHAGNTAAHLRELADQFTQAANTGDLSSLMPHGGRYHHAADQIAGDAQTESGKTASYTQGEADLRAELASMISEALSAAAPPPGAVHLTGDDSARPEPGTPHVAE
jgi:hypothetical protein